MDGSCQLNALAAFEKQGEDMKTWLATLALTATVIGLLVCGSLVIGIVRASNLDVSSPSGGTGIAGSFVAPDETRELGVPAAVTLAASTSGSICGLLPNRMYEITCSAAAACRFGAATPTALTTDNPWAAATKQNITLGATSTCVACISGSAAVCTASLHAL